MKKNTIESMKKIYASLGDEESKHLFESRVMYSLTGDYRYVGRMFSDIVEKKILDEAIRECMLLEGEVVFYGAGNDLKIIRTLYPDLMIDCICDKDPAKQMSGWYGIKVISPEKLLERKQRVHVVIVTTGFHKEIKRFLVEEGIKEEYIIDLGTVMEPLYNRQYFDPDIVLSQEEGVFIDGGCYDCSTSILFEKWCQGRYTKIYGFEPDEKNYNKCMERGKYLKNIELINKGLWDCDEILSFSADQGQASGIVDDGTVVTSIAATFIDRVVRDEPVTFIKLDVEGAELRALQGARNAIIRNRPRLAISIYHKAEDIFEIPEYILSLHNDYKLYIRHYQFSDCETILYAI